MKYEDFRYHLNQAADSCESEILTVDDYIELIDDIASRLINNIPNELKGQTV